MRLFLAVVLLMTMALFSAARGEERIALVVANPASEGSPAIANADLSAELVAATLRSLGFTVRQVSDGDRADVARAMHDFAQSLANPDSVGIFYYVGHTAQANGRNYLLTRGTRIDSKETVDQTALPLDLFMQALEATPTLKVVLLDNPGDGHNPTSGVMQGLAAVDPLTHAIVALSAKPGTVALDEARPVTVFADALTAALVKRGADIAIILASVRQTTIDKTSGAQWPWMAYGRSADAAFVLTPDQVAGAAPALPLVPEPAPPAMASGGYISGSGGWEPDGSDYADGSGQEPYPMDVAPGSGSPDAAMGDSAKEAALYEEYKRQEQQRQLQEEQARQRYEEEKQRLEDAAAAAAQNNLGGTYPQDGGATGAEPPPDKAIGAKIALAWTEICAFVVVRASDIARHGDFGAGPPRKVE